MGAVVELRRISVEQAQTFLTDASAFLTYCYSASEKEYSEYAVCYSDRVIVGIFTDHLEIRQTLFRGGQQILHEKAQYELSGDSRILFEQQVVEFSSLLSSAVEFAIDRIAQTANSARASDKFFAYETFVDDATAIVRELQEFVDLTVSRGQALLVYVGH